MKSLRLLPFITTLALSSIALADVSSYHVNNPLIKEALTKVNYKKNYSINLSPDVIAKLKQVKQQQIEIIKDLQLKMKNVNLSNNMKNSLTVKLNAYLTNKLMKSKHVALTDDDNTEMNFLDLRLSDAIEMLEVVKISAENTRAVLSHMRELAAQATSGVLTLDEMNRLDGEFQAYKNALNYIQTVDLLDGEKNLSQGNISIRIGSDNSPVTNLTIRLLPFDAKSLAIVDLSLTSMTNALEACGYLDHGIQQLNQNIAVLNTPALQDAEAMLASIPTVLYQDYMLLGNGLELIMYAVNGTAGDDDRVTLDLYLDYVKNALRKTQTYVSLDGIKMLGGGNIHIQIGNYDSQETTLNINLPVTDVDKLGLDKLNIKTQANSYGALDSILKDLRDFAYGNQ